MSNTIHPLRIAQEALNVIDLLIAADSPKKAREARSLAEKFTVLARGAVLRHAVENALRVPAEQTGEKEDKPRAYHFCARYQESPTCTRMIDGVIVTNHNFMNEAAYRELRETVARNAKCRDSDGLTVTSLTPIS